MRKESGCRIFNTVSTFYSDIGFSDTVSSLLLTVTLIPNSQWRQCKKIETVLARMHAKRFVYFLIINSVISFQCQMLNFVRMFFFELAS